MNWYVSVLKNYFTFSGRARRKEFWMFMLISVIITVVLAIPTLAMPDSSAATIPYYLYIAAITIPTLAVSVRRLHDTGRSGGWVLLWLIPIIGQLILLVFFILNSEGDNQFGPNPKGQYATA